tara:strand:+ start:355 stop:858 length:504 start_codon:yes stop_codon:yes gene_type:complete
MNNWQNLLQKTNNVPKWLPILFLCVALFGFADASYLTITHINNVTLPCYIVEGCDTVTTSKYSEIFGIPVSLLGTLYYLSIIVLTTLFLDKKYIGAIYIASLLTPLGLVASAYFMIVMFGILNAFCIYCIGSAISSTILFIFGMLYIVRIHNTHAYEQKKESSKEKT